MIQVSLGDLGVDVDKNPIHRDFRQGDVRHSQADVGKAKHLLGYDPSHNVAEGLQTAMPWYRQFLDAA